MPTAMMNAIGDRMTNPITAINRCQIGVEPPTTVSSTGVTEARTSSDTGSTLGIREVTEALMGVCMLMGVSGFTGCQADGGRSWHWGVRSDGGGASGGPRLLPHVVPVHEDEQRPEGSAVVRLHAVVLADESLHVRRIEETDTP